MEQTPLPKPKLKDFELPPSIDFTGEKAYKAYRKAKREWRQSKQNRS